MDVLQPSFNRWRSILRYKSLGTITILALQMFKAFFKIWNLPAINREVWVKTFEIPVSRRSLWCCGGSCLSGGTESNKMFWEVVITSIPWSEQPLLLSHKSWVAFIMMIIIIVLTSSGYARMRGSYDNATRLHTATAHKQLKLSAPLSSSILCVSQDLSRQSEPVWTVWRCNYPENEVSLIQWSDRRKS